MDTLLHEYVSPVGDGDGAYYVARVHGTQDLDGRWTGWIEFTPEGGILPTLRTGTETTQASRDALAFWATGLESTYLEGALARAELITPDAPAPIE
jgi:hypothetical protein